MTLIHRTIGQKIVINEEVVITIVGISIGENTKVSFSIEAPQGTRMQTCSQEWISDVTDVAQH